MTTALGPQSGIQSTKKCANKNINFTLKYTYLMNAVIENNLGGLFFQKMLWQVPQGMTI